MMISKNRFCQSLILGVVSLLAVSVQAAEPSTKIIFAKDSYCGSFSGDISEGKRFRLWLLPEQKLVVSNVGDDRIGIDYVSGPTGRLGGDLHDNQTTYITREKGNHHIKVYGQSTYSAVEFCAY